MIIHEPHRAKAISIVSVNLVLYIKHKNTNPNYPKIEDKNKKLQSREIKAGA